MDNTTEGGELRARARRDLEDDGGTTSHLSDYNAWAHSDDPTALAGLRYPPRKAEEPTPAAG